ncbi:MAG: hypothetical protein WBC91_13855 [Phototrophicaceae bacterium]
MNDKTEATTIGKITWRTLLCLTIAITVFALVSIPNVWIQIVAVSVLLLSFIGLSFYALKHLKNDVV